MSEKFLSEMLLTKFCHDIAGTAGAVMNGSELLTESVDDVEFVKEAASALLKSSKIITARIKFFRMAYGTGAASFGLSEAVEVADEYVATFNNITLKWNFNGDTERLPVNIYLMLMQIAASCLPRGGNIVITENEVQASGTGAFISSVLTAVLGGEECPQINAADTPALLLASEIKENNFVLRFDSTSDMVTFKVKKK